MKRLCYDTVTDKLLQDSRLVGFEEVIELISKGNIVDEIHSGQSDSSIFVLNRRNNIYMIPFRNYDWGIFLKSIIPTKMETRTYLKKRELA